MTRTSELHRGDCLEVMDRLPAKSVDFIFADLPYSVTACKWDVPIDLDKFWAQVKRVLKPSGIVVATAMMRFAARLLATCTVPYRYDLVWHKRRATGFLQSKKAPLRQHEHILVFAGKAPTYNVQMRTVENGGNGRILAAGGHSEYLDFEHKRPAYQYTNQRFPTSVISPEYPTTERGHHPTQKPLALLEYLIKTYTHEEDTVLDPVMGSGSTGVACRNLNRHFIGIEKNYDYHRRAQIRIDQEA